MKNIEIKKAKAQNIAKIIDYVPNSVVSKDLMKRITGSIGIVAFDKGEELESKISPFDIFIEIIEGSADIVIEEKPIKLKAGEALIIPAHASNNIIADERCKMLVTIIKSGYEEVVL